MSTETTTPQLVPSNDPTHLPRLVYGDHNDRLVFVQSVEAARLYIKLADAADTDIDGTLPLDAFKALCKVRDGAREARAALKHTTIEREGFGEEGWSALVVAVLA